MPRSLGVLGSLVVLFAACLASGSGVAAQDACVADGETTDQPTLATVLNGGLCLDGTLAEGDQDLLTWEVPPEAAATRWSLGLSGVQDALTTLQLLPITSDPGVDPPTVDTTPVVALSSGPSDRQATPLEDILLRPGRYVLAVFRSGPDVGIPDASTAYHVTIEPGTPLPASIDTEPNDDATTATPLDGPFSGSGDLASSDDHVHWDPGTDGSGPLWSVSLQVPLGDAVRMVVSTADGQGWSTVYADGGSAVVHDLAPDPAGYDIALSSLDEQPLPYVLSAATEPPDGPAADAEPDDQYPRALAIDPARPVARGRLATVGDVDEWRLTIDDVLAATQLDIRLLARSGPARRLCLTDTSGASLQCRTAIGGVALTNLHLAAGDYLLAVDGEADPDATYLIRIDPTTAPVPDYETEPNDTPAMATPFDSSIVMRGRAEDGDADTYLLSVTGEPQLWQVVAHGSDITSLDWIDGGGSTLGTGVVTDRGATATLYDLYLVPGEHRIQLVGDGGDYTLAATPMGPPDPDAEREPNDDWAHAQRLGIGDTRTGHLRERDYDWYRLSLDATEHISIDVDVPDDASTVLELQTGAQTIVETRGTAIGQDIHYDARLPAGDYQLWLSATQPSDQPYRLTIERQDPFTRDGDLEPDDTAATARTIPSSGIVEGTGWGSGDPDWYVLPTLPGGTFSVGLAGEVAFAELVQGDTQVSLRQDPDGGTWSTDEAPAGDVLLVVTALGDYTLRLAGASPSSAPPSLSLALALSTDRVAAWWPDGQHLSGTATITSLSDVPQEVTLEAWTSHYGWAASVPSGTLALDPGGVFEVPLSVAIQPDAWADTPVAVGVRAVVTPAADGQGGIDAASAWMTITPTGDATPVDPRLAWTVPDTLLGGLDVASVALGGVSDGAIDPAGEVTLHDGMAIGGGTIGLPVTDPVTPTTVDLAGDDPVPVAGIIIDPASGLDALSDKPRGFELWLSDDGVTWTSALTGELSPLGIDQAFTLPAAVPARSARLAITSTWASSMLGSIPPATAQVAEWKVIAAPGADPAAEARDIADPALGGHVVTTDPLFSELPEVATSVLDADLTRNWIYPPVGSDVSWIVGFLHDRAAQVTELGWIDPDGSDPSSRARRVTVEVSTVSPLGPWQPLGTWTLQRTPDGSVAPLVLDQPTWARFIRFGTPAPRTEGAQWELPGRITALERSTDDVYRSILGEWGQSLSVGPHELLEGTSHQVALDDPDVGEGAGAKALAAGATARGRVTIGADADEYRVDVPAGQRSISIDVAGDPVVGVSVRLLDPDGVDVPLDFAAGGSATGDVYQANVRPGVTYRVRVEQPPFSAVLMYDTSLSIANYWYAIHQGLTAFAGDVRRGRDRVMIIPFGSDSKPLLPDWTDDAYRLQSVLEGAIAEGDSSTEASVRNALKVLTARQGARAILLVTDGETSSFGDGPAMWQGLAQQRPLVYTVQIGGSPGTMDSTHLMQDLAASSGGAYAYVRTQEEMDRAFDRMATALRRPASYSLSYSTSEQEVPPPDPGVLGVVTPIGPDGSSVAAPVDPHIALELVLDTSGSMREKLGGTTRLAAAKDVLTRLVQQELPSGIPVALRWFRQGKGSCGSELAVPLGPLDRDGMAATIQGFRLKGSAGTPLAEAISAVADDLASVTGPRIVLVVSDGRESCGGDPEQAVEALRAQGYDITVNVVGIGLSKADRQRIRRLATLGGGSYFDARGAGQLDDAIGTAVSAPFEVHDATDAIVARGVVNGPALRLPPGTYRVVVLTDPPHEFEAVVLESGSTATLTLPISAPTP